MFILNIRRTSFNVIRLSDTEHKTVSTTDAVKLPDTGGETDSTSDPVKVTSDTDHKTVSTTDAVELFSPYYMLAIWQN